MASLNDIYVNILKEETEVAPASPAVDEIWVLTASNDSDRYFKAQETALDAACQTYLTGNNYDPGQESECEALREALVRDGFYKCSNGLEVYLQKATLE